jgi:prophage tail gpP-like protein
MLDTTLGKERVWIRLGGEESHVIERYEIRLSFFTQPGTFALRVGNSKLVRDLLAAYPPGTEFELFVELADGMKVRIMTGRIDHTGVEPSAGANEVTLRGRDWMAPLHDGMSRVERTFGQVTFTALNEKVILLSGVAEPTLFYDNTDNRLAVQGTPKIEKTEERTREFAIEDGSAARVGLVSTGEAAGSPFAYDVIAATPDRLVALPDTVKQVTKVVGFDVPNPLKLKLGTSYLHFLQEQNNRAGLFLFASAEPRSYILTRPNVLQEPTWRIVRRRGSSWGVLENPGPRYSNDTAGRFSHYFVRGRGGGGKDGKKQVEGLYVDPEMVGYRLLKDWSHEDAIAKTSKGAEYLARRMAAEKARAGWNLTYPLQGLSWPTRAGGRGVWCPDGMVEIEDEEFGLSGPFWISDVAMSGGANDKTSTMLTLHRPEHQLYGDEVLPVRTKGRGKR